MLEKKMDKKWIFNASGDYMKAVPGSNTNLGPYGTEPVGLTSANARFTSIRHMWDYLRANRRRDNLNQLRSVIVNTPSSSKRGSWIETKSGFRFDIAPDDYNEILDLSLKFDEVDAIATLCGDRVDANESVFDDIDLIKAREWNAFHKDRKFSSFLDDKILFMKDLEHALSSLIRYNGHKNFSVYDHSVKATALAKMVVPGCPEIANEVLLHDLHEAIVGDVIYPVRKMLRGFEVLEAVTLERLKLFLFLSYTGGENTLIESATKLIDHLTFLVEKSIAGKRSDKEWGIDKFNFDYVQEEAIQILKEYIKELRPMVTAEYAEQELNRSPPETLSDSDRLQLNIDLHQKQIQTLEEMSPFEFQRKVIDTYYKTKVEPGVMVELIRTSSNVQWLKK